MIVLLIVLIAQMGVEASTSSPTKLPTKEPTSKPTHAPSLAPSTLGPTESPTTHEPTVSPAPTVAPSLVFYKDYGFVKSFGDNIGIAGYDWMVGYLVVMYAHVFVGPIFVVAFWCYRKGYPDSWYAKLGMSFWWSLAAASGPIYWCVAYAIFGMSPRDIPTFGGMFALMVVGFALMVLAIIRLLIPSDRMVLKSTARMMKDMPMGTCNILDCRVVTEYSAMYLGVPPDISMLRTPTGYSGTLNLNGSAGTEINFEPTRYVATGVTKVAATNALMSQAAVFLASKDPAFLTLKANLMKEKGGVREVVPFESVTVHSSEMKECSHEIAVALKQALVAPTTRFSKAFTCPDVNAKKLGCSFALAKGTSEIKRAVDSGDVILVGKVPSLGTPNKTSYSCVNMGEALPYLMNGYKAIDHR